MAYGSPDRLEDVPAYYADIRGGRPIKPEHLEDLVARYRRLGIEDSNPLNEITEATRAALEAELGLPVFTGMRHWRPRIAEAVERALAGGADELVGLVLAPHYSSMSIERYRAQLGRRRRRPRRDPLRRALGRRAGLRRPAGRARARQRRSTSSSPPTRCRPGSSTRATPTGTSCSRPRGSSPSEPGVGEWSFSFQSESPTGEPWLGPDILDHLDALAADGVRDGARLPRRLRRRPPRDQVGPRRRGAGEGGELGLGLDRIELPNADPAFVRVLAGLVRRARRCTVQQV